MRTIVYIRCSTEEQAKSGLGIDAQRAKCNAYAELYELTVVEVLVDPGCSGKNLRRPGVQRALEMLRSGEAEAILVAKLDRLTRSVRDLGDLLESYFMAGRWSLMSVGEQLDTRTAAGRLVLNVLGATYQWEREATSERTVAALAVKQARGERTGSVPIGKRLGDDGATLLDDDAEQKVVGTALGLVAAGLSLNEAARKMTEMRMPTRATSGVWFPAQIKRIVERYG